jgi:hypothetical protein
MGTSRSGRQKTARRGGCRSRPRCKACSEQLPKTTAWFVANRLTGNRYRVGGARNVFIAAVERAGLGPDVTLHTLRHTPLSRTIAAGFDENRHRDQRAQLDRMLARYTHPTAARKQGALETCAADLFGQDVGGTALQPVAADHKQQEMLRILARSPARVPVSAACPR